MPNLDRLICICIGHDWPEPIPHYDPVECQRCGIRVRWFL